MDILTAAVQNVIAPRQTILEQSDMAGLPARRLLVLAGRGAARSHAATLVSCHVHRSTSVASPCW